jgi:tellurite resistance protein TerC
LHQFELWGGFTLFILILLTLDLLVFQKRDHVISVKEALGWSGFWVGLALLFNLGLTYFRGKEAGLNFLTGYLLEESLSVDNLFVFLLIFSYFKVPAHYQHKILFWGIIGAQIMRVLFIFTGVALINKFHWIIYVFGIFLVYTGLKLSAEKEKEIQPEKNPLLIVFRRIMGVTDTYDNGFFFVRRNGRLLATPLFVVLLVIETTDVVFALDSIPAILAITTDPFIVYTSNIFAILGLRSLYFALAGLMRMFQYLNYGLSVILVFIGGKMLISDLYKIPILWALGFIGVTLTISIIASILHPEKKSNE